MNFGQALEAMKDGKKVRRPEWMYKEEYYRIHNEFAKKPFPVEEKGKVKKKKGMIGNCFREIMPGEDESQFSMVRVVDCWAEWEERYVPVIVKPIIVSKLEDGTIKTKIIGEDIANMASHIDLLAEDWEVVE
jgi:hypothetical protein